MLVRSVCLFVAILTLSACQATSQYAGKSSLTLSKATADAVERYFENPYGRAIAVAASGTGYATTSCAHHNCVWKKYGTAEKNVMGRCESRGRVCGVFAFYKDIVWEGDIKLPGLSYSNDKVLRLVERETTSHTSTSTGTAILDTNMNTLQLKLRHNSSDCTGVANVDDNEWHIDCFGKRYLSGKLEKGSESLYWGRATGKPFELSIDERDWPLLREKLNERILANARPDETPLEINQDLALVWNSGSYLFRGKARRTGDSKNGTLVFYDDDKNEVCTGSFEVWYGTTGEWKLDCGEIAKLNGGLKIRNGVITGKGRDELGGPVTLSH